MPSTINAGTGLTFTNDNSGTLDVQGGGVTGFSVNSSAMYVKSVTTTQRNALTGTAGMIVYDSTLGVMVIFNGSFWEQVTASTTAQKAIFAYGYNGTSVLNTVNLVSNTGVVATNSTGAGTVRWYLGGAPYGGDKGIFGFGLTTTSTSPAVSTTNLVSNTGVVSSDVTGVGTGRQTNAASYGIDKAIFAFGTLANGSNTNLSNLVSNTGVVATDSTGVGTARADRASTVYGTDKAIFAFGRASTNQVNLVSNTGVVASDTFSTGTARYGPVGVAFGSTGQALIVYGSNGNTMLTISNTVSNTGTVASDVSISGTSRNNLAGSPFGTTGQAIVAYGERDVSATYSSVSNIISNTGVVASDTTGVGTARNGLAATTYSFS